MKRILGGAYDRAKQILRDHRATLDGIAKELLAKETLEAKAFHSLLRAKAGAPTAASDIATATAATK